MVSALISRCLILVLGTLFPAYRSYKAIKNKDLREYVKWMMYWIVFALFTTMETFLDIFFSWFPFYYEIKILFIIWVLSPATRGSSLLYKKIVHPLLEAREKEIDELIEKTKQQGYSTFLQLFSSGFQYMSNLFFLSAVKGQSLLGNQLKKSLSLNDVNYEIANAQQQQHLYQQQQSQTNGLRNGIIDEDEEYDPDYVQEAMVRKPSKTKTTRVSRKTSVPVINSSNNGMNYNDVYEFVDDGILISDDASSGTSNGNVNGRKTTTNGRQRRAVNSRQLASSSSSSTSSSSGSSQISASTLSGGSNNYKSNEVSYSKPYQSTFY